MSDFFQTGAVATLHRLGPTNIARMEGELAEFAQETPIALVLPCHVRELGTKALRGIVRELRNVRYLKQIIVGLDGASVKDWRRAKKFFSLLPQKPMLLWNSGPRMQAMFRKLEEAELSPGESGKGRNVWICFGYALASEQARHESLSELQL